MKKLMMIVSAAALIASCNAPSEGVDSGELEALKSEVAALKQDVYGGIVGNCPQGDWIASADDFAAALAGMPGDELEGEDWHKANGERANVMTTPSGLQYTMVKEGLEDGVTPYPKDVILANYHGILVNGELFDSSFNRGKPFERQANGVIAGWVEALGDMKPCEARTLYVPGYLAYGAKGIPNQEGGYLIPPNASLVFHMQLLRIKRPELIMRKQ